MRGGILEDETPLLKGGSPCLRYFPRDGFRVFGNPRAVMGATGGSFLVEGASIKRLTRARKILSPGEPGGDDNGHIGSRESAGTAMERYTVYVRFMTAGIRLVSAEVFPDTTRARLVFSRDGGVWKKLGRAITSHWPESHRAYADQPDRGIVTDRNGKYLYSYCSEHSRDGGRGVPECVARADVSSEAPLPGKWEKSATGGFAEDTRGEKDIPVVSFPSLNDSNALAPHPVYSASIGKDVMVVFADTWREYLYGKSVGDAGVYLCYSDDGVKWSAQEQPIRDSVTPFPGKSLVW